MELHALFAEVNETYLFVFNSFLFIRLSHSLIVTEELAGIPVLILANKQVVVLMYATAQISFVHKLIVTCLL